MGDTIYVDFQRRRKSMNLKERFKEKAKKTWNWVDENKELVIFVTPIVIGGLTTVARIVNKQYNLRKEQNLKELYCYDRSLGHYWRLKRDLSNKEWVMIDQRKKDGERLADILSELKVLK